MRFLFRCLAGAALIASTAAQAEVYTDTFYSDTENYEGGIGAIKFNPDLGTLLKVQVDLKLQSRYVPYLNSNNDQVSVTTVTPPVNGQATFRYGDDFINLTTTFADRSPVPVVNGSYTEILANGSASYMASNIAPFKAKSSKFDIFDSLIWFQAISLPPSYVVDGPGTINSFFTLNSVEITTSYFYSVGSVPEPATWAMMITGVGLIGAAARRRRSVTARYADA